MATSTETGKFIVYVNSSRFEVDISDHKDLAEITVLEFIRGHGFTGAKLGCGEGGCGACTVMVSSFDPKSGTINERSCNACLTPLCAVAGMQIITVEGLGSTRDGLHPVQEALARSHGSQCGFCTPGIVMAMYALLKKNASPSDKEVEESFDGNLCRCTGYRPILDSFKKCPKGQQATPKSIPFPQELMVAPTSLVIKGRERMWFRPLNVASLLEIKSTYPDAKIVNGNSELHIETRFALRKYPVYINPSCVNELTRTATTDSGFVVGAAVTLAQLQGFMEVCIDERPKHQTPICHAVLEILRWFAGHQIRNTATIGGNIATASPISDLNPLWMAQGAELVLASKDRGERTVPMRTFFTGYRKTVMAQDEIIVALNVPWNAERELTYGYKQARRRDDDIAIVNGSFRIRFETDSKQCKVASAELAFGGMSWMTVPAPKTEAFLVGKDWTKATVLAATEVLASDLELAPNAPGGQVAFRRSLPPSFLWKFFIRSCQFLTECGLPCPEVDPEDLSAGRAYSREVSKGLQEYEAHDTKYIHQPVMHVSAEAQVSGEAVYVDDISDLSVSHCYPVLSKKAHAKILSVDTTAALAYAGVEAYISAADVPGDNNIGAIIHDEEIFATDVVVSCGQLIGLIVARDLLTAKKAAALVVVEYEDLPAIITIDDAIAKESFFDGERQIVRGDVDAGFAASDHICEGTMEVGGQEQFYLETNTTYAVPGEFGSVTLHASTQNPSKTQLLASAALGIPASKVDVHVKRMGGGFGGKETRSVFVSCAVAVAANRLRHPVKWTLDRDTDMITTGMRHPYVAKYKAGFSSDGLLNAVKIQLYSNGGYSLDLSLSVMERAVFHVDNAYKIPAVHVNGRVCRTNTTTNTAFRGFGGPQGMIICENIIDAVAVRVGKTPEEIRELNMYSEGDLTHYNQVLTDCLADKVWKSLKEKCEFESRRKEVSDYNKLNRWNKRGVAMVPVKFGMSFGAKFMNQGGALVHVYTDGTVLLSHGGTEMGQGLHTKMIQVAAHALGADIEQVYISETSTASVANSQPTAASVSSDIYGNAILDACNQINERLAPYYAKLGSGATLAQVAKAAYFDRVDLSAHGFYTTPDVGFTFNGKEGEGMPFNYFSYGAAFCEVEIDTLTGDHTVLRTDIVMDVGKSLNPVLDIGQIEGAWVQGYGLFTLEEVTRRPDGSLFTAGPGTYKLPGFQDVPLEFNVTLLPNVVNRRPTTYSSKGIGEPPLFLGAAAYFAIKDACRAARTETGCSKDFSFASPATSERIRMACVNDFSRPFSAE